MPAIIPSRRAAHLTEKLRFHPPAPYHSRMNAELFSATVLLILVIDPFGNVPLVVSALKNTPPERHVRVVLRECAAAYVILVGFMLGGPRSCNGCTCPRSRSTSPAASSCF